MKSKLSLLLFFGVFALNTVSAQQQGRQPSAQFPQVSSLLGSQLPEVSVFDEQGKPFSTRQLSGKYTVLVFGCLT
jgi:cytochrome oxidase Cu insertion factor (SCO1/SenC/PrrC family)|tara:strand:+ start:13087 stop:13311 length:225 start_codon:yes stop_codon:yes gene_type:complete